MTQWWAGPDVADRVFARLRPHLPMIVHGYRLCGVNLRFRAYKYAPYRNEANDAASEIAEEFLPHFDDGWEGSVLAGEDDCLAHWRSAPSEGDDDTPDIAELRSAGHALKRSC